MKSLLKLDKVSKKFGNYEVLKSVSLEVKPGEIHGLLGENGAGKSTLLNILFGRAIISKTGAYSGDVYWNGIKTSIRDSQDAINLGIGMVHQEFALIPDMTVGENIMLGNETVFPGSEKLLGKNLALMDKKKMHLAVQAILNRLGVNIDSRLKVLDLSVNFKQFIELAREIRKDQLQLLILDEPTAALGQEDAARLLSILLELSKQDISIILVSHRLEELISVCDKITVLRNGKVSASFTKEDFDIKRIAESMVGHEIHSVSSQRRNSSASAIIQYLNFTVDMPGDPIKNVNLDIYEGEIIGIAGLSGHGKLALGNGTFGIYPSSGEVRINGQAINIENTAAVIDQGIYLLPEERREAGLLLDHSIMDNIIFTAVQKRNRFLKPFIFSSLSFIDKKKSSAYVQQSIKRLDIRCNNLQQKVGLLSGGNQQKVCLARAIAMEPRVLFVAEPTRGIDIGAKEFILQELLNINRQMGTTLIIASSELGELKRISDRIVVMYEGRVFTILAADCDDMELAWALSGERLSSLC